MVGGESKYDYRLAFDPFMKRLNGHTRETSHDRRATEFAHSAKMDDVSKENPRRTRIQTFVYTTCIQSY